MTHAQFQDFLDVFGFGPGVLLDNSGRLIDLSPFNQSLVGADLAAQFAHVARAADEHGAVSNVVSSVVGHEPIVAFTAPFTTPYGRRMVSGAFDIASRPMGLYLRHALPYSDGAVYLVDSGGQLIAANTKATSANAKPPANVSASAGQGQVIDGSGRRLYFTTVAVNGTPWRLVITLPTATLFQPIGTTSRVLAWGVLAAFALALVALVALFVRSREGRAIAQVDARTDTLTGLPNRRAMEEALARHAADHQRYGSELAVLIIDIDRFKTVNDELGHGGGDIVLRIVAARAGNAIRVNDILGRWGGEEFVVVAANTHHQGVSALAERLRRAVNQQTIVVGSAEVAVTVSVGGTIARPDDTVDDLVARADAALYTAKNTGRDRSVIAEDIRTEPSKVRSGRAVRTDA